MNHIRPGGIGNFAASQQIPLPICPPPSNPPHLDNETAHKVAHVSLLYRRSFSQYAGKNPSLDALACIWFTSKPCLLGAHPFKKSEQVGRGSSGFRQQRRADQIWAEDATVQVLEDVLASVVLFRLCLNEAFGCCWRSTSRSSCCKHVYMCSWVLCCVYTTLCRASGEWWGLVGCCIAKVEIPMSSVWNTVALYWVTWF